MMLRHICFIAAVLAVTSVPATAQLASPTLAPVPLATPAADDAGGDIVVVGEDGSGTTLSADSLRDAAQAFQRHRAAFAPAAQFIFQVDVTGGQALDAIDLRLRNRRRNADGGHDHIDIDIDANGQFVLPVAQVLSGDWALRTASRAGLRIRPLILSPGSTRFDRRFGDVRLQCRVFIAFARMNFAVRALAGAANLCNRGNVGLYQSTPRPIERVTISGWTTPIEIRPDRLSFRVPLHERGIGNDARIIVTLR